jgi:hypothetical protein
LQRPQLAVGLLAGQFRHSSRSDMSGKQARVFQANTSETCCSSPATPVSAHRGELWRRAQKLRGLIFRGDGDSPIRLRQSFHQTEVSDGQNCSYSKTIKQSQTRRILRRVEAPSDVEERLAIN